VPRITATILAAATLIAAVAPGMAASAAPAVPFTLKLAFARFDKNGDGKLDQSEQAAVAGQRLDRIDANSDGALSREELVRARDGNQAGRAEVDFARMDANRDGMVSRTEFVNDRQQQFAVLADADGDGLISLDEMARMSASLPSDR
jgi:Ca2+-binding EF-hand superfamily protein